MKFLKSTFLLLSLLVITACSNDDDANNVRANEINVGTQNFEITQAIMFNDGTFNDITEFELYITGSGFSVSSNEEFIGSGDFISLRFFSGEASGLETGEYVYDDQNSNSFILNRGYHFLGFQSALGDGQSGNLDIESGSVSVALENNVYTVTLNLTDEDNNTVTGYYKGMITIVN